MKTGINKTIRRLGCSNTVWLGTISQDMASLVESLDAFKARASHLGRCQAASISTNAERSVLLLGTSKLSAPVPSAASTPCVWHFSRADLICRAPDAVVCLWSVPLCVGLHFNNVEGSVGIRNSVTVSVVCVRTGPKFVSLSLHDGPRGIISVPSRVKSGGIY